MFVRQLCKRVRICFIKDGLRGENLQHMGVEERLCTEINGSSLHIKNTSTENRECAFTYFLFSTLNFVVSFLKIIRLCGKILKIIMPA